VDPNAKIPWNKGLKVSEEARQKSANQLKSFERKECPHCGKTCDLGNYTQ